MEVRYARSFLTDLKKLPPKDSKQVYNFTFIEFNQSLNLHFLPELRQLDLEGIFYRFTLGTYLVGIEVTGEIVKFLRVIPMPDV